MGWIPYNDYRRNEENAAMLRGLEPGFAADVDRLLGRMKQLGHKPLISEGFRSLQRQRQLWAKGRICVRGRWFRVPGKKIVTKCDGITNVSEHQKRRAVDIICAEHGWNPSRMFWEDLWHCAGELGLDRGPAWDYPHIQKGRI